MDISVLIPTHDRPAKLSACIAALARQSLPGERYEVLVGTDGPDDAAHAAAHQAWEAARGARGGLTIVQCKKAGPGPTRNRLIELARAPTLLLLNDDVVPDHRLLESHAAAHRELASGRGPHRRAMILGAAPWAVHAPDRLFDRLIRETSMVFFYDQMTGADPDRDWGFRHAWTLNLSLPAAEARAAGGFDAALQCACFEDLEFAWRVSRRGLPVLYRPAAAVTHDHRYEPAGYLEREETLGREAFLLAAAAPQCAREIFGRDVRSEGEVAYSRAFVERERAAVGRLEASFLGLADLPAGALGGAHASALIKLVYEQHLLLKRWRWRKGLLAAADGA